MIGTAEGPGFLEESMENVVRDSLGRFWLSQRGRVKIFDGTGTFVSAVGRPGQGPLEFDFPRPIHVDADGRVHIFDRNLRETVVSPDGTLRGEHTLPGPLTAVAPLPGPGHRYVTNAWLPTPDHIGLPLHLLKDGHVTQSFGVSRLDVGVPMSAFSAQRTLAVGDAGGRTVILSAKYYDYDIEVWTDDGQRIIGFRVPGLNEKSPEPGSFSVDNPPPNRIWAIRLTKGRYLWIVTWQRRADWLKATEERISATGELNRAPVQSATLADIFHSRIEILDLDQQDWLAETERPELFFGFVGEDLLELAYESIGAPVLGVWSTTFLPPVY